MGKRVLVGAALVLGAVVVVGLWLWEEGRWSRQLMVKAQRWSRGGDLLVKMAFEASDALGKEIEAESQRPFEPWEEWPPELQEEVTASGLIPVGTKEISDLVVTTFVKSHDLERRWFYVVPRSGACNEQWFCVLVMSREYYLWARWPATLHPIMEKQKERPVDPIKVIKRLCSERDGPGAGSEPIP